MKLHLGIPLILVMVLFSAANARTGSENEFYPVTKYMDEWGIEIVSFRQSAEGYMLDFRYRVIDPEKALPLADRRKKAYLVDEKRGVRLDVPNMAKVGSLRQTADHLKEDRIYFVLFANPGRMLQSGETVTVVIGEFRAEDLKIQ